MLLLTHRQIRIFLDFYNNSDAFITLSVLAEKYELTVRTIQNDIAAIKDETDHHGMIIVSQPGTGCKLSITNHKLANQFVKLVTQRLNSSNEFSNQNSRVHYLISYLINNDDYVKSTDLADMLYISQSRISSDLKLVRQILSKYELELLSKPSYGIRVSGDEVNKRFCLIKESIFAKPILNHDSSDSFGPTMDHIDTISDIVTNVFLRNKYRISEIVMQNLIIHIQVAISRIKKGYYLDAKKNFELDKHYYHASKVAKEIMEACTERFNIEYREDEVLYLTVNIYGKRELDDTNFITSHTNHIIVEALGRINDIYHLDLTNELELRISLGLHLTPLIIRVENNMQFNNMTLLNLKQMYPLAHNIATDFVSHIFSDATILTEDEISYIAVHFITYVESKISNLSSNNILIISPYRQSDTFLMRQKIIRNINNINEIRITSETAMDFEDLTKYSVVLTTEKSIAAANPTFRLVNYFLDDNDMKKIDYALRGLNTLDDILSKFDEHLFFRGRAVSKSWITTRLINLVKKRFNIEDEFEASVRYHESKTPSSYFGNGIAILHPEEAVTDTSFVAVALLDEPIKWDYESSATIVLLVSIEKNNPKAFQLWNLLSELISNELFINAHETVNDYSDLYTIISDIYTALF